MIFLKTLLLALLLGLGACSDAATRLAYHIKSAALKLKASDKNSTEIKHTRVFTSGKKQVNPLIDYYRKQTNHGTSRVAEKPSREIKLLKSFPFINLLSLKLLRSS